MDPGIQTNSDIRPPEVTEKVTLKAIELGYRHVRDISTQSSMGFNAEFPPGRQR